MNLETKRHLLSRIRVDLLYLCRYIDLCLSGSAGNCEGWILGNIRDPDSLDHTWHPFSVSTRTCVHSGTQQTGDRTEAVAARFSRRSNPMEPFTAAINDRVYMSRKIRKLRTDKFDGETNGNFDSCNSCNLLGTSRLHELHESKFPFVSRIEFIRSKLSNFSDHVYGVNVCRPQMASPPSGTALRWHQFRLLPAAQRW